MKLVWLYRLWTEKIHTKMFLSYIRQNPVDSDKIWNTLPWINLWYSSLNVFQLIWIMSLHWLVNRMLVSQDRVETLFRWGKCLHFCIANYSGQYVPNFITINQVLWTVYQKKHFGVFFRFTVYYNFIRSTH